jgi:inorganic pyrophosphatase
VPHSKEKKLREEVKRMVELGVMRKVNRSEWAFPAFTVPKKDTTLRSIADLRELNKRILRGNRIQFQKYRTCCLNWKDFYMQHHST